MSVTQRKRPDHRVYFDGLSTRWPAKYFSNGSMSPRIARFLQSLSRRVCSPADVLDFGCGTGELARACAAAGYSLHGIDCSTGMIDMARAQTLGGVTFKLLESENGVQLPYDDASFDVVVASSVLEYLDDPMSCLSELRRLCRAGGWLFATVPNLDHRQRKLERSVRPFAGLLRPVCSRRGKDWLDYIELSVQRHTIAGWQTLLSRARWHCEVVSGNRETLWLIEARTV